MGSASPDGKRISFRGSFDRNMFKDHFTKSAPSYSKYRPDYPDTLFRYLASLSSGHETALDCATGSGQAAAGAAPYYRRVAAVDGSRRQVQNASASGGIAYMVSLVESLPLKDRSVDLVMAAQAAHWFDLSRFYPEVRRVVKPGGVVALWCYSLLRIDPEIDRIVDYLFRTVVGSYWPPERKLVDEGFASLYFPFPEIVVPDFPMESSWDLAHLLGYLGTWSAVSRYQEARGEEPVELVRSDLAAAWGNKGSMKRVKWPIHMRVGSVGR